MKTTYYQNGDQPRTLQQVEFSNMEEFEEARQHIEALLLENHRTVARAEYLANEVDRKRADLEEWQNALDREQDLFAEQKEKFETDQHNVMDLQSRISLAIDRVNAANRDPIETINEILLMLELDASPEEIAKLMREKREALDVKW